MTTTITAVFPSETHAIQAVRSLLVAGFDEACIEVIRDDTPDRHRLVGWETSDWLRGALLGGVIGALGMLVSAWAMTGPLAAIDMDTGAALIDFGGFGAVFGSMIGLLVGSGTGHQQQEHYEYLLENGSVLLAVNACRRRAKMVLCLLTIAGGKGRSTSVHLPHLRPAAAVPVLRAERAHA